MQKKPIITPSTSYSWQAQVNSDNPSNIAQVWIEHLYGGSVDMWYLTSLPTPPPSPDGWIMNAQSGQSDSWTVSWVDDQNNLYSTGYDQGANGPNENTTLVITLFTANNTVNFTWGNGTIKTIDVEQYGNGYNPISASAKRK